MPSNLILQQNSQAQRRPFFNGFFLTITLFQFYATVKWHLASSFFNYREVHRFLTFIVKLLEKYNQFILKTLHFNFQSFFAGN